jgi:hypothetical protein
MQLSLSVSAVPPDQLSRTGDRLSRTVPGPSMLVALPKEMLPSLPLDYSLSASGALGSSRIILRLMLPVTGPFPEWESKLPW